MHRAQSANVPEWESHRNWKRKLSLDLKHCGLEPADDGGKKYKGRWTEGKQET